MNDFYLNACGAAVNPSMILKLLVGSGLQWEMHPAQLTSLEYMHLYTKEETAEVEAPFELGHKTSYTLMGIPVKLCMNYPMSLIRLMYEGEEVTRLESLAVPIGFGNGLDFDAYWNEEKRKFQEIGPRSLIGKEHASEVRRKKIEKVLCERIKLVGEEDQLYTGYPQQLIDELTEALK